MTAPDASVTNAHTDKRLGGPNSPFRITFIILRIKCVSRTARCTKEFRTGGPSVKRSPDETARQRADARKAVYDQDNQFYRYRDGLKWTRIRTVWLIELAVLYAAFSVKALMWWERPVIVALATFLMALVYWLAVIDGIDVDDHLTRIKQYEGFARAPYVRTPSKWRRRYGGVNAAHWMIALIFGFNLLVVARLIIWPVCLLGT